VLSNTAGSKGSKPLAVAAAPLGGVQTVATGVNEDERVPCLVVDPALCVRATLRCCAAPYSIFAAKSVSTARSSDCGCHRWSRSHGRHSRRICELVGSPVQPRPSGCTSSL
jgi:hypothetical protein